MKYVLIISASILIWLWCKPFSIITESIKKKIAVSILTKSKKTEIAIDKDVLILTWCSRKSVIIATITTDSCEVDFNKSYGIDCSEYKDCLVSLVKTNYEKGNFLDMQEFVYD